MHEFSLAQSVMATVAESARQEGIRRISRVSITVGEWAAVLPDALRSSWEIITCEDQRFAGAELLIHQSAAAGACTACGLRFPTGEAGLVCPACGGPARLAAGTELAVDSYEGE